MMFNDYFFHFLKYSRIQVFANQYFLAEYTSLPLKRKIQVSKNSRSVYRIFYAVLAIAMKQSSLKNQIVSLPSG